MNAYDLVVIGSGPSGRRAAVQGAKLGRSVLVIDDRRRVGGVSVHTGTIPSKTLRETALNLSWNTSSSAIACARSPAPRASSIRTPSPFPAPMAASRR